MHAIVICFDRLPYGLLGCYGNTEARTPGFDRLAAQSVTFDNCFAADLRQEGVDRDRAGGRGPVATGDSDSSVRIRRNGTGAAQFT